MRRITTTAGRAGTDEFDAPRRLSVAAAWQLPFGKGKKLLTGASRAADLVVGGWTLSTFNTFQDGFPSSSGCHGAPRDQAVAAELGRRSGWGVSGSINSRLDKYSTPAPSRRRPISPGETSGRASAPCAFRG